MNASRARIFVSYSHRGNGPKWKARLLRHLGVFEEQHLLDVWQDGKIRVSSYWNDDIQQAMSNARLAVVLLTKEVLESEYIQTMEFPFLSERQQRDKLAVFPVVCEECEWKTQEWLRATQAPNASNPLSQLPEAARESIFRQLATDIAETLSHGALAELSKPVQALPPDRVYLDRFSLPASGLGEEKLIGREQELGLLDLAFAQPQAAIVSLVAWGGVGKTTLVQHWLQRLQRENWFGAQRVYAWSFYSQGTKEDRQASEDMFLAHALNWFGVQCEPTISPWDKGRLLAQAVMRERTLIILDGIEPLQYPPGPMGGQLRAPGVQSLLKQLARKANANQNHGLCLVTTREPLTDLGEFQRRSGSEWGSVLRVDLANLTEEAGAALLHHAGAKRSGAAEIKSDDSELLAAFCEVDGHALTLNLLGRFLARAHGGDVRRRDLVKFEEADRKEQGGSTFKMLAAFESWFARSGEFGARQLSALRMLGLFDRPADAGCIGALREPPIIVGLTDPLFTTRLDANFSQATEQPLLEEDMSTVTSFLADFGLIMVQAGSNRLERLLDCHPLIREYFAQRLRTGNPTGWRSANLRLYDYLKDSCEYQPDTIDGLQPLYQAIRHGCLGERDEDASEMFARRIFRGKMEYSSKHLGAIAADLSAISAFFPDGWKAANPRLPKASRLALLGSAGYYLATLGRTSEALGPMEDALTGGCELEEWNYARICAFRLSCGEREVGKLAQATYHSEKSIELADLAQEATGRMQARADTAYMLFLSGKKTEALERFQEAEAMQARNEPPFPLLYAAEGFDYCQVLLSDGECVAWKWMLGISPTPSEREASNRALSNVEERGAQFLKWRLECDSLFTIARENLTLSQAALYRAASSEDESNLGAMRGAARDYLNAAFDGLAGASQRDELPRAYLSRAWLHFLEHDLRNAESDLGEAWDIAERGPMRLHMADIHLYRARLFFREQHYPWGSPQEDLAAAEKLINDCGYHCRDEELADAKRAILGPATLLPL